MKKNKKIYAFFMIALKSGGLLFFVLSLLVFVFFAVSGKIFDGKTETNNTIRETNYVVSGRIKEISAENIFLEVLVLDSVNNFSAPKVTEIKKMKIGDEISVKRLIFYPTSEEVVVPENPTANDFLSASKFRGEIVKADFAEIKAGDNINADYYSAYDPANGGKDTISSITILPYTAL